MPQGPHFNSCNGTISRHVPVHTDTRERRGFPLKATGCFRVNSLWMGDGIPLGFNSGCGRADHFAGGGMGMSGRDGFPQEINLHRAFCTPHSPFRTWQALQGQGFGGAGAGGHAEKLKLGKQKAEIARWKARQSAAASCRGCASVRLSALNL